MLGNCRNSPKVSKYYKFRGRKILEKLTREGGETGQSSSRKYTTFTGNRNKFQQIYTETSYHIPKNSSKNCLH